MSRKLGLRKRLAKLFSGGSVIVIDGADAARVCARIVKRMAKRMPASQPMPALGDNHGLLVGGTRKGKSVALEIISRASLARGDEGLTCIDPHGSFVRAVRDWCANPANAQFDRAIHFLDPSSSSTFGLNPLRPYDGSWEACHDAAVTLASVIESRFEASPEQTPRLARIVYVAGMLCARNNLTVLELVEVLSLGGDELRRSLLEDFDNRVVRRDLEDLHYMANHSPREFVAQVESAKNRFLRWIGSRRLARILGQKGGLDPLAVMDGGDIVLADFSSLTYEDAAFLGCLMSSMYFAAARRRTPMQCARHRLILDEAESLVTIGVARMCDQSAKMGLLIAAAIQRLGQLRARGDFIADALLTNCSVKICFGGLEVESARYIAENMFAGHLNMQEFKPASVRPVAVGNDRVIVRNRSRAHSHGQHNGTAMSETTSSGRMVARSQASTSAWGAGFSDGTNASLTSTPEAFPFTPPSPLSQSAGQSRGRNVSSTAGNSSARSSARQNSHARGTSTVHASSRAVSVSEGESEAYLTRYEHRPTEFFSLEEQLHKVTAALINLPRRQYCAKIEDQAPYIARTPDLVPAFKTAAYRDEMLARFMSSMARRSAYLVPAGQVDAEMAARAARIVERPNTPEPEFTEPVPIIEGLERARQLFNKTPPAADKSSSSPTTSKPKLRVVDGGKDGGDIDNA